MELRHKRGRREAGKTGAAARVLTLLAAVLAVGAAGAGQPGVRVEDAFLRLTLPTLPAAGYMRLRNTTGETVVLMGASSPACGRIMMHETVAGTMRRIDRVRVPAHGEVRFAPGGIHLMCMSPATALTAEARVPVTLSFETGAPVTAFFAVQAIGK